MIKKLSKKLVLVFSMLAVVIFTVSSCYATPTSATSSVQSAPYSIEDIKNSAAYQNLIKNHNVFSKFENPLFFAYEKNDGVTDRIYVINGDSSDDLIDYIGINASYYLYGYNTAGQFVDPSYFYMEYNHNTGEFTTNQSLTSTSMFNGTPSFKDYTSFVLRDITTVKVNAWGLNYEPVLTPSTDFDYILSGIKRGAVKLEITGLNPALSMYGYVGVKNNYEIGDIFDGSSVSEYLRLLTIYSDNSDLNCTLYRGEELVYYILDSNNVILDIGTISEMAKDCFLYGFQVDNGVDFEFLKDGQVYWSDSLTFKYQLNNSTLLTNNSIVSSVDNYIKISNTLTNVTCDAIVYLNGNEISTASVVKKNNLSSLSITVHSSYYEVDTLFNKNTSVYTVSNLFLEGTDEDGNTLDFSRYRVRWSIPTWLELKQITLAGNNYSKYNGTSSYFSAVGSLNLDLKIFEIVDDHKAPFDITLEILNSTGDVVLTKLINSDAIVKEEVARNENNVDKDDFEIIDSPNYTGGSNNYPGADNIHNWNVNDFANYLGTNNTMFSFFWAFLDNMPAWIATPLTILLIGLVVITLYKFIRG